MQTRQNLCLGRLSLPRRLQILPSHSPCEQEAASSQACRQVEDTVDALRIGRQYSDEIGLGNEFSKSCSPSIDNGLNVDGWRALWEQSAEAVAEDGFGEAEEHRRPKRLTEKDNGHGDWQYLRRHRVLDCNNGLQRQATLLDIRRSIQIVSETYHL